jgi:hypothetical protein
VLSKFKIVFCNEPIWLAQKKVLKFWKLLCKSIYSKYKNIKVPILGHLHRFPRGQCLGKTYEMKWGDIIGQKIGNTLGTLGGEEIHWELGGNTLRKTKIPKYPQKLIRFLFMLLVCGIFVFFLCDHLLRRFSFSVEWSLLLFEYGDLKA